MSSNNENNESIRKNLKRKRDKKDEYSIYILNTFIFFKISFESNYSN